MLDTETKSRIDSARDILVGKVPDPKSQVEQITIALIYKFMDDMDRQSEEVGGKSSFFKGEFKKYRWADLLDKRFGGHERLLLYAEGIERMNENKNIPQLFRDIFKGVFLPYRDPETLNLFLKEINGFTYDHSERLGDAYEYLLSVLGTQGDAGQFRTPRHHIDFMVQVIAPQKHETFLDPACATAGFPVSAYKYILKHNENLTPDERARLMTNFCGYDIAPDMVRLSRVNLYLHGFPNPVIHEYDTLTSEERWDERYDVIMANPPFMTPKGGIRPHNRFSIKANRSEVLFVDYIAEHLNPGGRAGIIVPEGIIFQGQNAYKNLRRMLVENYLWAVVSLPAGVFNPYSGVKTSILFLDRNLARLTDAVLFVKIENDGFDLGAQRRPIEQNDLPEALKVIEVWKKNQKAPKEGIAHAVSRKRLLESPDCNLSGDRYRAIAVRGSGKWPMVKLGEIIKTKPQYGSGASKVRFDGKVRYVRITDIEDDGSLKDEDLVSPSKFESDCILQQGDLLLARSGSVGRAYLHQKTEGCYQFAGYLIRFSIDTSNALPLFVFHVMHSQAYWNWIEKMRKSGTISNINATEYSSLEIPLPPVAEQERLVVELEGYRKIIEGARQILVHYKPTIRIDPTWPRKKIAQLCELVRGSSPRPKSDPRYYGGKVPRLMVADLTRDGMYVTPQIDFLTEEGATFSRPMKRNEVVMAVSGNPGLPAILQVNAYIHDGFVGFRSLKNEILPEFFYHVLSYYKEHSGSQSIGAVFKNLTTDQIKDFDIPVPPLAVQREIVAELESERALVEANRELIARFENKLQAKLAEIWGEEESAKA